MAGILSGQAVVVEYAPSGKALVSGQAVVVEYIPSGKALLSGAAVVVEYIPTGKALLSGTVAVVEYVPYIFVEASLEDSTGNSLSSKDLVFGRRFTGQRRKNKRDS